MRFCTSILTFWPTPPPPPCKTFLGGEEQKKIYQIFYYGFVILIRGTFCKKKLPGLVNFSPQNLIYLQQPRVQEVTTTNSVSGENSFDIINPKKKL